MSYNFNNLNKNDDGIGAIIIALIFVIALAFGISCLYAWVGMLLWNWVIPTIWVGAPVMEFWPMWGLVELCSILFKTHNFSNNK